ncbi:MAG: Gfo/Idh/MocA family oxidoreductase [Pseudomonadota bacterium]
MLRWGILSTAKIGITQMIPALQLADNGTITAIASRDLGRAQDVAQRFGIPNAFGSYDELLQSDEVDAVYIPLITSQHVEWSIKAADAGKHVLCEKPLALNAKDIQPVIDARDRNNVLINEAFMVAYHPQWYKARALIADGAIGTLKQVQGVFTYFNRDPSNMRNQVSQGGGGLPDIGVYPIVTTRLATGEEPLRVSASIERDPEFGTDIHASARIAFGSFELSMYVGTQMALRQHMVFHGDEGWIELTGPFNPLGYDSPLITLHNQKRGESQQFRYGEVNQYQLQAETFARAVSGSREDRDALFSLEDSVRNQKVIDATYRSAEADDWQDV